MKVIGAGYGRTGTMSLKAALEVLGHRCYHMEEAVLNFERGHLDSWNSYITREAPMDWAGLFEGYEATVDFPSCVYYREIMQAFPDAKVILTVREASSWWASMNKLIETQSALRYLAFLPRASSFNALVNNIVWSFFDGKTDQNHLLAKYSAHNEEVKASVPESRLLVYSVGEGWGPLCEFLGTDMPAEPFPHRNAGTAEVRRKMLGLLWKDFVRATLKKVRIRR